MHKIINDNNYNFTNEDNVNINSLFTDLSYDRPIYNDVYSFINYIMFYILVNNDYRQFGYKYNYNYTCGRKNGTSTQIENVIYGLKIENKDFFNYLKEISTNIITYKDYIPVEYRTICANNPVRVTKIINDKFLPLYFMINIIKKKDYKTHDLFEIIIGNVHYTIYSFLNIDENIVYFRETDNSWTYFENNEKKKCNDDKIRIIFTNFTDLLLVYKKD